MKFACFHVSVALIHKLAQCAVLENVENDKPEVGHATFMQSVVTEEVLDRMYGANIAASSSLVENENEKNTADLYSSQLQDYWVHDPSDDPTSPQHGWVHVEAKYKPHVRVFERGEKEHGIECSESGTSVRLATNHVEQRNIRSGSLLLIEQCATSAIDVKSVQALNSTHSFLLTQPVSLADIGQHVERQRIAFHVPIPGNDVPFSLDEAYAEFEAAGIRTRKHTIHRVKRAPAVKTNIDQTLTAGANWSRTWTETGAFAEEFGYDSTNKKVTAKLDANIAGDYAVSVTLGTALVGECITVGDKTNGFKAYIKGNMDASAKANMSVATKGEIFLPLSGGAQRLTFPIIAAPVPVNLFLGADLNLIAKMEGSINVTVGAVGHGEVQIGGYYNRGDGSAQPIYGGTFVMQPDDPKVEAVLVGSLVLDIAISFGVGIGLQTFRVGADVEIGVNMAPGVYLNINNCAGGLTGFAVDVNLDVMCGAKLGTNWQFLFWEGHKSYTLKDTSTCDLICKDSCKRELVHKECVPAGAAAPSYKETATDDAVWCDEATSTAYMLDSSGNKKSADGYQCVKDPPVADDTVVSWAKTVPKRASAGSVSSVMSTDDYYQY